MGLKAIENGVIRFTDVKVPGEPALGRGQGTEARADHAQHRAPDAARLGRRPAASAAWRSPALGRERVQWGQAVGKHDAIAQKIGRMAADLFAMEAVADLALAHGRPGRRRHPPRGRDRQDVEHRGGWRIVDDTLQIRGGRGYETADSPAQPRGAARPRSSAMMRDFRINLIFEGSSEIMRLFIAREAVDTHLKVAGALIDPKTPVGGKLARALQGGAVLRRLVSRGSGSAAAAASATASSGRSPRTSASSTGQPQARAHPLPLHGALRPEAGEAAGRALRLVDIGAELFAMSAACGRAQAMVKEDPANRGPVELADLFCRQARRRIDDRFGAVFDNDDVTTYRTAQRVLAGEHAWLEQGMVRPATESPA